jgi:hypothetical protein
MLFLYEQDWIRYSGTPSKSLIWVSAQRLRYLSQLSCTKLVQHVAYLKLNIVYAMQTKKEIMHKNLLVTSDLDMATCQAKWQRDYEKAGKGCMHRNCSTAGCDYGSRQKEHLVLTGSLFGIWPAIDRAVKDSKVVRLEAGENKRVVGLRKIVPTIFSCFSFAAFWQAVSNQSLCCRDFESTGGRSHGRN